ncbi:AraC family transcriptional regulator [Paenibacillus selenitireducens]|uniref:AraC family transcriptional regulator n=1 Tax=Paenibacillus selenitireducens TaxID=1324314 RepID=A0A1T2X1X4_9BACL|nr:GyrI-like domain-containing protein [Paenibacillus selenitireducens]OPA73891.1 AraC family transcriptional regulator [Paenibacillus selenitireducens]
MNQQFTHYPAIELVGISTRTTNAEETGPNGRLPKLWETYFQSNMQAQIKGDNAHLLYALYTDYESDASGAYTVLLGHEKGDGTAHSETEWVHATVPEAKYMVFTTKPGPVYEVVYETWQTIWAFFQDSSIKRAYTGDFELYRTQQFDPNHAVVEIYIAVQ